MPGLQISYSITYPKSAEIHLGENFLQQKELRVVCGIMMQDEYHKRISEEKQP